MKRFGILPAAAGIIALTATACFAQDQSKDDESSAFRTRVMVRSNSSGIPDALSSPPMNDKTGHTYLVEVEHGNKTRELVIDAHTGKVLGKRDISA